MNEYIKKFKEWIGLKEVLDNLSSKPPLFKEGEIWWCALGENVGVEICGKSKYFSRPVFVYRKLSKDGFLAIPMTTKSKDGSWYVSVKQDNRDVTIILSQTRMVSSKRLQTKIGELDDADKQKVSQGFERLFVKNISSFVSKGVVGNPKYDSIVADDKLSSSESVEIKAGQLYKHYKGDTYKIITLAKHSETGDWMVVYERATDIVHISVWKIRVRPMDMFLEIIERDGKQIKRFELIKE